MRIAVTGQHGQVALSLAECGSRQGIDVVLLGRPALDLEKPNTIRDALAAARPDVVVNAAAYTAVDKAESEPELAKLINGVAAGLVADVSRDVGVPVIQLSTDYVFDGTKSSHYLETDDVGPIGVYGASKLAGELAVAAANPRHVILRTAWVYSPFGHNFVKTMLRLAATRDELSVVADQQGCPTYAPDIAEAVIAIALRLTQRTDETHFGIFNLSGSGEATWAEFAEEIFRLSALRGGPAPRVRRIATKDYPTPARRPGNSRLDGAKLYRIYGLRLPDWRESLAQCMKRLQA